MASKDPLALALKANADAVEEVLETFKKENSNLEIIDYCQLMKDVKVLFGAIQALEDEHTAGSFNKTAIRARRNMIEVLNECGQHAKVVCGRIRCGSLRDDANLSVEIATLSAEIGSFVRIHGTKKEVPVFGLSQIERREFDVLSTYLFVTTLHRKC